VVTVIGSKVGNCTIIRKLGERALGPVYLAERAQGWEQVAIKVLAPALAAKPAAAARFLAAARATARVRHDNVVRVEECGLEPSGECFMIMEVLHGESLAALLRRVGRLPVDRAVDIAAQIADGVAAAHAAGVVHGDLSPSNVLLLGPDGRDRVTVIDFGLAAIGEPDGARQGGVGLPYRAPEAASGAGDHRVDVYALGCLLYEMVTGQVAYPAGHGSGALAAPATLNPHVSPVLEAIILRALDPEPGRRTGPGVRGSAALRRDGAR
jgi:serine/threonine-protein kinase